MLEIILSIIVIVLLIVCLILISIFIYKNNKKKDVNIDEKINNLTKDLTATLKLSITEEMLKVSSNNNQLNENNNAKLERFQTNITQALNNRFDSLNEQVTKRLNDIDNKVSKGLNDGFLTTSKTISEVQERLAAIDQAQKNIQKLSTDVTSLKQVLENNQSRGQYGEYQLSMVLHNVFGDTIGCYDEQYTIKRSKDGNDVRADAVVFMPEPNKMICIDSKFPFANYTSLFEAETDAEKDKLIKEFSNDVKKHITTIKDKYIIDNKTAPEAIMFIPNDGVFAFIHQNCFEVVEYAREKQIIITSPSTLPAILVTINMVRLEVIRAKNLKEISSQLAILGKQFSLFAKEWDTFSRQLEQATRTREKLDTRVNRITNKFDAISTNEIKDDVEQIENNHEDI